MIPVSGQGFLIGQQYNENGIAEKDRKGNPLAFDPDIAPNMMEDRIKPGVNRNKSSKICS